MTVDYLPAAKEAFKTLDVPEYDGEQSTIGRRVVWDRAPGREGYLDRELLDLVVFDAVGEAHRHLTRSQSELASRAIKTGLDRWNSLRFTGILRANIGSSPLTAVIDNILPELTQQAFVGNRASVMASKVHIAPDQTTFALWDNGRTYDVGALSSAYLEDAMHDLREGTYRRRDLLDPPYDPDLSRWPTRAIVKAMHDSRATVTVASQTHALDVTPTGNPLEDGATILTTRPRDIPAIEGNAVVVRLPHAA